MKKIVATALALIASSAVLATPIVGTSGSGAPALAGSTNIPFSTPAPGSYAAFTVNGVTFTGIGGGLRIATSYAGSYNTRGPRYLDNNGGGTSAIRFDFANPLSAFAFNFGASDAIWTLKAYNSGNTLLESYSMAATHGSNAGDYFGLANSNMAYATLTGSNDWVMLDNFTTVVQQASVPGTNVPEPASLALLGLGMIGLWSSRKRKQA